MDGGGRAERREGGVTGPSQGPMVHVRSLAEGVGLSEPKKLLSRTSRAPGLLALPPDAVFTFMDVLHVTFTFEGTNLDAGRHHPGPLLGCPSRASRSPATWSQLSPGPNKTTTECVYTLAPGRCEKKVKPICCQLSLPTCPHAPLLIHKHQQF